MELWYLFQLLIISLTFAAFTIGYNSSDRLNVTITLFLTAVAFKLVVKQSLPTISYLTYLVSGSDLFSIVTMKYCFWFQLLIISLTFAAFTIDYSTADRITVTITLFLTAVAFKLVVKQSLPTISYLTYLVSDDSSHVCVQSELLLFCQKKTLFLSFSP